MLSEIGFNMEDAPVLGRMIADQISWMVCSQQSINEEHPKANRTVQ